jgi:hypothetical protein
VSKFETFVSSLSFGLRVEATPRGTSHPEKKANKNVIRTSFCVQPPDRIEQHVSQSSTKTESSPVAPVRVLVICVGIFVSKPYFPSRNSLSFIF